MRRRSLLTLLSTGATIGLSGCLNGEVKEEVSGQTIRLEPQSGWEREIGGVDGSGAIGYTVRSETGRFQVYYFRESEYEQYLSFLSGETVESPPTGIDKLHKTAVYDEKREVYEARVPSDGGRTSIGLEESDYFVIDYSMYGIGLDVDEHGDDLRATVTLQVVEDRFDFL
jgi:hypothetical protein